MSLARVLQREIFERDNFTCCGCRKRLPPVYEINVRECLERGVGFLVVDHIEGRSEEKSNLQALCWACNSSKAGRSQHAFLFSVLTKRFGNPVVFYPSLMKIFGLRPALLLCDLIYWVPKGRHEKASEGWIYKSAEELKAETGLSYKEQYRARQVLASMGVVEQQYAREDHRLFMRINMAAIDALLPCEKTCGNDEEHRTICPVAQDNGEAGTGQPGISYKGTKYTPNITPHKAYPDLQRKIVEIAKSHAFPGVS